MSGGIYCQECMTKSPSIAGEDEEGRYLKVWCRTCKITEIVRKDIITGKLIVTQEPQIEMF